MVANGEWKNFKFKPYNWKSLGQDITTGILFCLHFYSGNLHPLMKVRK